MQATREAADALSAAAVGSGRRARTPGAATVGWHERDGRAAPRALTSASAGQSGATRPRRECDAARSARRAHRTAGAAEAAGPGGARSVGHAARRLGRAGRDAGARTPTRAAVAPGPRCGLTGPRPCVVGPRAAARDVTSDERKDGR